MLHVNDVTIRIEGRPIIDGATFALREGDKAALVGRNGSGKSTLLKAILGRIHVQEGEISIRKGARVGAVDQEAPGGPVSVRDQVLTYDAELAALRAEEGAASDPHRIAEIQTRLGDIGAHDAEARAAAILAGLGFDEAAQLRPCSDYSGGWRMRVALAGVLFAQPDLLLLDEPTNYLDLEGVMWLEDHLQKMRATVLIVSHDRDLLNAAPRMIVHLNRGKTSVWAGNYDAFEQARAERLRLDLALKAKQDAERKHLQSFVDRFRAKATKATQAQSRLKRLAKMTPIAVETGEEVPPFVFPPCQRKMASPLIRLEGAETGYEPGRPILTGLDLRLDHDDRIGLLGRNGAGKSTFAKLLADELKVSGGALYKHKKTQIAWFAQHQLDALDGAKSAYDHVAELVPEATEAQKRARAAQFGLPGAKADTPAKDLSGGERARLLLNLIMFRGAHLLILDEPTNHLDMEGCEALTRALLDFEGAVLLISHDRRLVDTIADRLWIARAGTVKPYPGTLDDYRAELLGRGGGGGEGKTSARSGDNGAAAGGAKAEDRRVRAAKREELKPLKQKADSLERRIVQLTGEVERCEAALAAPGLFERDPARAAELGRERARAIEALEQCEAAWLDAAEAYEQARLEAGV